MSVLTANGSPPVLADSDAAMAMALLAAFSQSTGVPGGIPVDADVQTHDKPYVVYPKHLAIGQVITMLERKRREWEEEFAFSRSFKYRPEDGAVATARMLKETFGITAGKAQTAPSGRRIPPQFRTIEIGPGVTTEVPWGAVSIPSLGENATLHFGVDDDAIGPVLELTLMAAKKHKETVEAFYAAIERELEINSIYRGHALRGAHELSFMDLSRFDPTKIVYATEVHATLDAAVFAVLRNAQAAMQAGASMKRSVLIHGPFGTGKTSLGLIAAQEAVQYGWTFLSAKAGEDDLEATLRTATLYEPAVVFVEDVERFTPDEGDRNGVAKLLDMLDGAASKSAKVILIMTTNHAEQISAGMLRPGRTDYVIEIAGLDAEAAERLIRAAIPEHLLDPYIDWSRVHAEMQGFQPAWVRAVLDRARDAALARTNSAHFTLTTMDLVIAARSLNNQLDMMNSALETAPVNPLDQALVRLMEGALQGTQVLRQGMPFATLETAASG